MIGKWLRSIRERVLVRVDRFVYHPRTVTWVDGRFGWEDGWLEWIDDGWAWPSSTETIRIGGRVARVRC